MEIIWCDADHLSARDAAGVTAVIEAARAADKPYDTPGSLTSVLNRLRHGWDGEPSTAGLVRDGRGRVVAVAELNMSEWDNRHMGYLDLVVDPVVRRSGVGRLLFESAVERILAAGRSLVIVDGPDLPASAAFAEAVGLERASAAVQRRQDLTSLDWSGLDAHFAEAEQRAADYELLRVPAPTPDDMIEAVAHATHAINDAPTDDLDIEDEVYGPERIRSFESAQMAKGKRLYRLVARRHGGEELAGQTVVAVDVERPWLAWQYDTSVQRAHRGHRLGLLLKIGMLRWLAEAEPQLRQMDTWNAATNAHMIQVNEILGYQVVGVEVHWQRKLGG